MTHVSSNSSIDNRTRALAACLLPSGPAVSQPSRLPCYLLGARAVHDGVRQLAHGQHAPPLRHVLRLQPTQRYDSRPYTPTSNSYACLMLQRDCGGGTCVLIVLLVLMCCCARRLLRCGQRPWQGAALPPATLRRLLSLAFLKPSGQRPNRETDGGSGHSSIGGGSGRELGRRST